MLNWWYMLWYLEHGIYAHLFSCYLDALLICSVAIFLWLFHQFAINNCYAYLLSASKFFICCAQLLCSFGGCAIHLGIIFVVIVLVILALYWCMPRCSLLLSSHTQSMTRLVTEGDPRPVVTMRRYVLRMPGRVGFFKLHMRFSWIYPASSFLLIPYSPIRTVVMAPKVISKGKEKEDGGRVNSTDQRRTERHPTRSYFWIWL